MDNQFDADLVNELDDELSQDSFKVPTDVALERPPTGRITMSNMNPLQEAPTWRPSALTPVWLVVAAVSAAGLAILLIFVVVVWPLRSDLHDVREQLLQAQDRVAQTQAELETLQEERGRLGDARQNLAAQLEQEVEQRDAMERKVEELQATRSKTPTRTQRRKKNRRKKKR